MERYRQSIQHRCWLMGLLVIFGVCCLLCDQFWADRVATLSERAESYRSGFATGVVLVALWQLWVLVRALRDPKKLEALYADAHDTRKSALRAKTGMPVFLYTTCGLILAALAASFFNEIVFKTLVIVATTQIVLGCGLKRCYSKTM